MPLVKVFNDNIYPHKERFKGEMVEIPAGGYVEMEWEEAMDFRGQFTGIAPIGANGAPDERFFKKIRVEPLKEPIFKDASLIDPVTGRKHSSAEELRAVLSEYGHLRVNDPEAEKATKSATEAMAAQIAALEAKLNQVIAEKTNKRA